MGRIAVAGAFAFVLLLFGVPGEADAQGRFDPRRQARFMFDANLAYSFVGGELGDILDGGPGVDGALLYQIETIPLRVGGGAGYSRHGIKEEDGSANRFSLFALAELLLFNDETEVIPYLQGRVGWMQLTYGSNGLDSRSAGLELAVIAGVDIPVAEKISVDVSGSFGWVSGSDVEVDGITVPDTSRSGSLFSIRAGAFFFFF